MDASPGCAQTPAFGRTARGGESLSTGVAPQALTFDEVDGEGDDAAGTGLPASAAALGLSSGTPKARDHAARAEKFYKDAPSEEKLRLCDPLSPIARQRDIGSLEVSCLRLEEPFERDPMEEKKAAIRRVLQAQVDLMQAKLMALDKGVSYDLLDSVAPDAVGLGVAPLSSPVAQMSNATLSSATSEDSEGTHRRVDPYALGASPPVSRSFHARSLPSRATASPAGVRSMPASPQNGHRQLDGQREVPVSLARSSRPGPGCSMGGGPVARTRSLTPNAPPTSSHSNGTGGVRGSPRCGGMKGGMSPAACRAANASASGRTTTTQQRPITPNRPHVPDTSSPTVPSRAAAPGAARLAPPSSWRVPAGGQPQQLQSQPPGGSLRTRTAGSPRTVASRPGGYQVARMSR